MISTEKLTSAKELLASQNWNEAIRVLSEVVADPDIAKLSSDDAEMLQTSLAISWALSPGPDASDEVVDAAAENSLQVFKNAGIDGDDAILDAIFNAVPDSESAEDLYYLIVGEEDQDGEANSSLDAGL